MLMDLDEIEDMLLFPLAPNTYWDPFDKKLRIDPGLSKVYVGGRLTTVEASIAKTNAKRSSSFSKIFFYLTYCDQL
jgi:hypothetical protein